MASTNKTANYELSQFLGSDKPTWLTDYNSDMSKIDAGMEANKAGSEANSTAIEKINGDISSIQDNVTSLQQEDVQIRQDVNTLQTNQQNLQTRMGKAESDISEIKGEIRKEEEVWIIVDNQNGIGVKDGTYQTAWPGYAMGYLGLTESQVIVRCAAGAGVVSTGTGGATYKSLIELAGNAVDVKTRVSRIIIGSLLNDHKQTIATEIASLLSLRQWCNLTFPAARVEWCEYYYPWADPDNKIPDYWWRNEVAQQIGSTGIRFCADFNMPTLNKTWFQTDGVSYNDEGQHQLGMRMANYLLTGTFDMTQPEFQINTTAMPAVFDSANFGVVPSLTRNNITLTSFWHEKLDKDGLHIHAFIMTYTKVLVYIDVNATAKYLNNGSRYWNPGYHDTTASTRPDPTEEYWSYGHLTGMWNVPTIDESQTTITTVGTMYVYPYAGSINGLAINGYKSFSNPISSRSLRVPINGNATSPSSYMTLYGDFGPGQY